ncbi:MAG: hypothetical protein MKZ59_05650 [Deinococcales bacterium]|nr:hypothetical protein [Deinococcales bacterium]
MNAIVLFLRLFGAHLLLLVAGRAVFVLSRPLWSGLIKSTWGRVAESIAVQISPEPTALYSLLAFFAPFYLVITTLVLLVAWPMWTTVHDHTKTWRRVFVANTWIHAVTLLLLLTILNVRLL